MDVQQPVEELANTPDAAPSGLSSDSVVDVSEPDDLNESIGVDSASPEATSKSKPVAAVPNNMAQEIDGEDVVSSSAVEEIPVEVSVNPNQRITRPFKQSLFFCHITPKLHD